LHDYPRFKKLLEYGNSLKKIRPSSKEIRLVVLPFDNLGPSNDEWFADGITDEITARLASIHGLGVISRQSGNKCKQQGMDTRQIADKLTVDYILDGTVQCDNPADSNSQVRLSLQLTDTSSDTLIWRDSYDRVRGQMFELQSEIAEQVAQQLDILLLEQDRTWSKYIPTTDNVEAYNLWLKGTALGPSNSKAIPFYEEALKLDPNFARAHSALAWVYTHMYFFGGDRNPERLAKAESAARKALKLAPDIPGIQVTMARVYYQGYLDYANALKHLDRAIELQPNHTWALYWKAAVQRRQGNREETLANQIRAFELNPLSDHFACSVGNTCKILRKYPKANHYHELAIELNPTKPYYYSQKAWLFLVWHGDLLMARTVMEEGLSKGDPAEDWTDFNWLMVTIDILDGQYLDALDHLSRGPQVSVTSIWFVPNDLRRAEIYGYLGRNDLATQHYESALMTLKAKVQERREDDRYQSSLGIAYAGLGNKDEAIYHGEYGREMSRVAKDTISETLRIEDLACIYVMVDEHNKAIDMLEELLRIPSRLSHKLIAIDPVWDPLRELPDFKKLLESNR
jgi:serine/threonine-protein kinase